MNGVLPYLRKATEMVPALPIPNRSLSLPAFLRHWDGFARVNRSLIAACSVALIGLVVSRMAVYRKAKNPAAVGPSAKATPAGSSNETLEHMTKAALYEQAKSLAIEGRSLMNKQELISALRAA